MTGNDYTRANILNGLAQCTPAQVDIFKRMYGFERGLTTIAILLKDIDTIVAAMPVEKLDHAMMQVERTVAKNAKGGVS